MRLAARSGAWLLPLLLTGCVHVPVHWSHRRQAQAVAPPLAASTSPKPATTAPDLPASATVIPPQPLPADTKPLPTNPTKKPDKHKKPAATIPQDQAIAGTEGTPPPSAINPGVSAIGQISLGGHSDSQQQTVDSLNGTERDLNGISRRMSDAEQKTAIQIRAYIKQARTALTTGDVDGAETLAAKAKVLLSELNH
jgi:hypothetical protein